MDAQVLRLDPVSRRQAGSAISIWTASNQRLTIDPSGNVIQTVRGSDGVTRTTTVALT